MCRKFVVSEKGMPVSDSELKVNPFSPSRTAKSIAAVETTWLNEPLKLESY